MEGLFWRSKNARNYSDHPDYRLGVRFGLFVHTGRIHSHSIGYRDHRDRASCHSRSKATVAPLECGFATKCRRADPETSGHPGAYIQNSHRLLTVVPTILILILKSGDAVMSLIDDIGSAIGSVVGAIGNALTTTVNAVADTMKSAVNTVVGLFHRLFR